MCSHQTLREEIVMLVILHHFFMKTLMENWTHQESTCSANWFAAPDLQQIKLHVLMSRARAFWVLREGDGEVTGTDWGFHVTGSDEPVTRFYSFNWHKVRYRDIEQKGKLRFYWVACLIIQLWRLYSLSLWVSIPSHPSLPFWHLLVPSSVLAMTFPAHCLPVHMPGCPAGRAQPHRLCSDGGTMSRLTD